MTFTLALGLGLTGLSPKGAGAAPPSPGTGNFTLTLTELSRDRAIFDSGAQLGLAVASIPRSGTTDAPDGTIIQMRAVSVDDGGASNSAWQDVSTAAGGVWFGAMQVARSTSWYLAEVRVKASTAATATTTNRFGVGHIIAIWGQSEIHQMLDPGHDVAAVPAVTGDDVVQVFFANRDDVVDDTLVALRHEFVTAANPVTGAVAAMANTFMAERPGEKFAIVFQVKAGTGWVQLGQDSAIVRTFATDKAIHDLAVQDGQKVGIVTASWFASPSAKGDYYEDVFFPLLFGKLKDGTAFATPNSHTTTFGTVQVDHTFLELYDYSYTRWAALGPHRFDPSTGQVNRDAIYYEDPANPGTYLENFKMTNIQRCRKSWRNMAANPNGAFLPQGIDLLNYVNGEDDGAGNWRDWTHPADDTPDGLQQLAKLTAHGLMQSAGLVGWAVPRFDNCAWDPAGAFVDVWSSAGPVTTTRLARGLAALPATYSNWTEVVGWQINDLPAQNVIIVDNTGTPASAGRVRIYPNSGPFIASDQINYGQGGGTGMLRNSEDNSAGLYLNIPIVEVGAAGVEGISISALPDPAVLANTIVDASVPIVFSSVSGAGGLAAFQGPNIPAATSAVTIEMQMRFTSLATGFETILQGTGSSWIIAAQGSSKTARMTVRDSANTYVLPTVTSAANTLPYDQWCKIRVAIDLVAQTAKLFVDDVAIVDTGLLAGSGLFATSRRPQLALSDLDLGYYRQWYAVEPDGSAPVATPDHEIQGNAAAVNGDAWRTANGTVT